MEDVPQQGGHQHGHKRHRDQWSSASACGSGEHKAPRGEDELQDMRAIWRNVLQREGKLVSSAVKPTDVAPKPAPPASPATVEVAE
jgi:hypothetical protein